MSNISEFLIKRFASDGSVNAYGEVSSPLLASIITASYMNGIDRALIITDTTLIPQKIEEAAAKAFSISDIIKPKYEVIDLNQCFEKTGAHRKSMTELLKTNGIFVIHMKYIVRTKMIVDIADNFDYVALALQGDFIDLINTNNDDGLSVSIISANTLSSTKCLYDSQSNGVITAFDNRLEYTNDYNNLFNKIDQAKSIMKYLSSQKSEKQSTIVKHVEKYKSEFAVSLGLSDKSNKEQYESAVAAWSLPICNPIDMNYFSLFTDGHDNEKIIDMIAHKIYNIEIDEDAIDEVEVKTLDVETKEDIYVKATEYSNYMYTIFNCYEGLRKHISEIIPDQYIMKRDIIRIFTYLCHRSTARYCDLITSSYQFESIKSNQSFNVFLKQAAEHYFNIKNLICSREHLVR